MLRQVVVFVGLLVCAANCQMDLSFCDPTNLKPDPSMPDKEYIFPKDDQIQYQMSIEENDASKKSTFEMDQYYDGPGNRAVTFFRSNNLEVRIYMYGNTNERVTYIPKLGICTAKPANDTVDTPIPSINAGGVNHIVAPISLLHFLNKDFKLVYIGKDNQRGVPVDQYQACFYRDDTKLTQRITVNIADADQWTLAEVDNNVKAIPVGSQIDNKLPNGTTWTNTYTITKFRAANLAKEEIWTVANGIYCDGRQKGKALPNVPKAFSFRSQVVSPVADTKKIIGSFTNIREVYNHPQGLFRFDYISGTDPITEVHDFNTGLRYTYNRFKGNCSLSVIDPGGVDATIDGQFIKMRDPQAFFDFNTAEFQYVGQKRVGDINTDVWIGSRQFFQRQSTWQWHFMADGWFQKSRLQLEAHEPVLLLITFFDTVFDNVTQENRIQKTPVYYYIYDFDESGNDLFKFDITPCFDEKPKRHFSFNLPTKNRDRMEQFKTNLKTGALLGLVGSILVVPLRIQELEIEFYEDNIQVVFTLLEKAEFYGPVKDVPNDLTMVNASLRLNATLNAGKLVIPFIIANDDVYDLIAEPNTLRELETRRGERRRHTIETVKSTGYSGGAITAIAIVMLLVGGGIGLLGVIIYKLNYFQSIVRKFRGT